MSEALDRMRAHLLHRLARDHPGAAPFTLALHLSVAHGHVIDGRRAKHLMATYPPEPQP